MYYIKNMALPHLFYSVFNIQHIQRFQNITIHRVPWR